VGRYGPTSAGTRSKRWRREQVAAGATRLSAKELVERIRVQKKISINNSDTALLARDCEADHPVTRGLFERKERKAS
jgi:hypothetical protein